MQKRPASGRAGSIAEHRTATSGRVRSSSVGKQRPVATLRQQASTEGVGHRATSTATMSAMRSSQMTPAEELRYREEECMRRNAELGARTTQIMEEAQALLEGRRPLSPNQEDVLRPTSASPAASTSAGSVSKRPVTGTGTTRPKTVGSHAGRRSTPLRAANRPPSAGSNITMKGKSAVANGSVGVHPSISSHNAVSARKQKEATLVSDPSEEVLGIGAHVIDHEDVSDDVGGAVNRLLKARVVVLQEELQSMVAEGARKDATIELHEGNMKKAADERTSLRNQLQVARAQLERLEQQAETAKQTVLSLEKQLSAVRKDYESSQTTIKQMQASHSALDVRLNRALEEAERSKSTMQQRSRQAKEASDHDRQLVEQLQMQAKQHEKQKADLIAVFKKQMKLVDVLKQQKMHIEAARVLEFSETEFINLLDWGSGK